MRPTYPSSCESWWLDEAVRLAGAEDVPEALSTLEGVLGGLSDLFTVARPDAGFCDYAADPLRRAAYGLFFFPQTYVRTALQLEECRVRCGWRPPSDRTPRILDLGAGTGAAGLAVAEHLRALSANAIAWRAVDRSAAALNSLRRMAGDLIPDFAVETTAGDLRDIGGRASEQADVIVVSFALNECIAGLADDALVVWTRGLLDRLAPGGLLLISEPASVESWRMLLRLRSVALDCPSSFDVMAPCLHRMACPMVPDADVGGFCHEVRSWAPPESVHALNRRLHRAVHVLKYSFLAVCRRPAQAVAPGHGGLARLVTPAFFPKGRIEGVGCCADGGIRRFDALLRGLTGDERHAMGKIERGDVMEWAEPRLLGDKKTHRAIRAVRLFGYTD